MKRITRDFITLFNTLWYRDFPLSKDHKQTGSRAEWTTHIGICSRAVADLMGYFTYFEHGNRTDVVIKDNAENIITNIEFEWKEARDTEKVNEIRQLKEASDNCEFSVFIGYSDNRYYNENLNAIKKQWGKNSNPLVIILIRFNREGSRVFENMEVHHLQNSQLVKKRTQPALPWLAKGKRWESNS